MKIGSFLLWVFFGCSLHFQNVNGQNLVAPIDKRNVVPVEERILTPRQQAAFDRLRANVRGVQILSDALLGKPSFVYSLESFLTPAMDDLSDPHDPVKRFLNQNADLFDRGAEILATAKVSREYVTEYNQVRTVIWQQQFDGISVFEAFLKAHITQRGELVNISHRLISDLERAANLTQAARTALVTAPDISAAEAVLSASIHIGEKGEAAGVERLTTSVEGPQQKQLFAASFLTGPASAELIWLPMDRSTIQLCWRVILTTSDAQQDVLGFY